MTYRHTWWPALALAALLTFSTSADAQQRQSEKRPGVNTSQRIGPAPAAQTYQAPNRLLPVYSNTTPIDLTNGGSTTSGPADVYPSEITVSGFSGPAGEVSVTLLDVNHTWTGDIEVLLVAPNGDNLLVMDGAFGSGDANNSTIAIADGGTAFPSSGNVVDGTYAPTGGTGGNLTAPAPARQGNANFADAFTGDDPNGTWSLYVFDSVNGDTGNVNGGWELSIDPPAAGPVFSLTSVNGGDYGPVGACTVQPFGRDVYTVINSGLGTLDVTGATVSGLDAALFTVDDGALPASLASGESVDIPVTITPTSASDGPVTATLSIDYDDGTAQTSNNALTATATNENPSFGSEAGYAFGNSTACNTGMVSPGTALVDFSGHTEITFGNAEDGFFEIDEATLDALGLGSFKLFGDRFEQLFISTNGGITFGSGVSSFLDFPDTTPSTDGGGAITAYMDLDLNPGNLTAAVPQPGVFYGMDGDNLVVTYAYARFYTDGTSEDDTPWLTMQFILEPADDGDLFNGAEDNVEIRFIGSSETNGSGQPYTVASGVRAYAFNQAVGLFNPEGTVSVSYLSNGFNGEATASEDDLGGGFFDAAGNTVAVRFEAETQASVAGGAGWRMMGAPVTDMTVGRLADLNLVQGVVEQYPTADPILFTGYDGTAYTPAVAEADLILPGQGFFWYLFGNDLDPVDPNPNGAGTSNSYATPFALQGTGLETTDDPVSVSLNAGMSDTMVGNPFRSGLDVSDMATWAQGGTVQGVGQIWSGTSYITTTDPTLNEVVSAWQGMFVENVDATSLDIPASAKTTGGSFVYRSAERPRIAFELAGMAGDVATLDRALILELSDDATDGWDLRDASKYRPLLNAYATAAFLGERDGAERLKAQESRSIESEGFEVPVVIDAVGVASELTLTWPTMELDDDVQVSLRDLVTGDVVDLRTETSYTFSVAPETALEVSPAELLTETVEGATAKAGATVRFVLAVGDAFVSNESDDATEFALEAARPNPMRGSATVRFALPEAGDVEVALYDLLGRRVAVVAQGDHGAGWHTAEIDADALSAGVYVLRMQTGTFAETQRITVVR